MPESHSADSDTVASMLTGKSLDEVPACAVELSCALWAKMIALLAGFWGTNSGGFWLTKSSPVPNNGSPVLGW
jgi:hypothetical protein